MLESSGSAFKVSRQVLTFKIKLQRWVSLKSQLGDMEKLTDDIV